MNENENTCDEQSTVNVIGPAAGVLVNTEVLPTKLCAAAEYRPSTAHHKTDSDVRANDVKDLAANDYKADNTDVSGKHPANPGDVGIGDGHGKGTPVGGGAFNKLRTNYEHDMIGDDVIGVETPYVERKKCGRLIDQAGRHIQNEKALLEARLRGIYDQEDKRFIKKDLIDIAEKWKDLLNIAEKRNERMASREVEKHMLPIVTGDTGHAVNNQIIGIGNGHDNGAPVEGGALSTNFGQATIGCSSNITQSESDNDGRVMPMVESLVINTNESDCCMCLNDNLAGLEPLAGLENESISVVGVDSDTAVSKIMGESMVTRGVSRSETGAEFVARVGDMYQTGDLEFTSSSEGESEMSEEEMPSERSEDVMPGEISEVEMSREKVRNEFLTYLGNVSGETKPLDSKIVLRDLWAKDSQYILFMLTEWLRINAQRC